MKTARSVAGSRGEVPCGVQGTEACRALWEKQAGGVSEIARSAACGTTMRVSRTRAPEQVWDRSRARPVGGEARRSVWKRKGALARLFRFPGRQPKNPGENAVSEQTAKRSTIETDLFRESRDYSERSSEKLLPRPQSNGTCIAWSVMQPASCRIRREIV